MGGDSGASGGCISQHQLAGQSPHSFSTRPAAGLTHSRLLDLFQECVDNGFWASLETNRRRGGAVVVDFRCRIEATSSAAVNQAPSSRRRRSRPNQRKRARNMERTREWRETRQQHRQHPPPASTISPPAAKTATVEGPITGEITAARSFAAVAAQPVKEVPATATPAAGAQAVKTVLTTVAGNRGPKATGSNPTKRAKNIMVASRASQRAKILSKRRAVTDTETPATPPKRNNKEEGATPEILRGIDGVRALDLSLDPPYPPPPPSLPPLTPVAAQATGDSCDSSESGVEHRTAITEADFYQDVWEGRPRLKGTGTRDLFWLKMVSLERS